jgi:hypothetical protein
MKDFVYAPEVMFVTFYYRYMKNFFIGTKDTFFVCPEFRSGPTGKGKNTGSGLNLFEGKKASIFLMDLVNDPATNAEVISEKFAAATIKNMEDGHNNIARIDIADLKRLRFNAKWYGNGIAAGHTTNIITGDRIAITRYGKSNTKSINDFYTQYFPMNRILKAEENFK